MKSAIFIKVLLLFVATHFVSGCEQIMKALGACEDNCDSQQANKRSTSTNTLTEDGDHAGVKSEKRSDGSMAAKMSARYSSSQTLSAEDGSEIDGASVTIPPNGLMIDTEIAIAEGAELNRDEVLAALNIDRAKAGAAGKAVAAIASSDAALNEPMTLNIPLPEEGAQLVGEADYVVLYHAYDARLKQSKIGVVPTSEVKVVAGFAQIQSLEFGIYQALRVFAPVVDEKAVEVTFPPTIERKSYSDVERAELIPVVVDSVPPVVGVILPIENLGMTSFDVRWSAATDATTTTANLKYLVCLGATEIAVKSVSACESSKLTDFASATSAQVTGRSSGQTYFLNVVVRDEAQNKSVYLPVSVTMVADTAPPTVGVWNTFSSASLTGFTLNWTAATDNSTATSQLLYYVCSSNSPTSIGTVAGCEGATKVRDYAVGGTSLVVTGLTPQLRLYYNLIVKDAAGNKAIYVASFGETLADTTAPTVGAFSASTNVGTTGFTLNWSAATDNYDAPTALQYLVCEGSSAADIDTVSECDHPSKRIGVSYSTDLRTMSISSKSIGTPYFFNVVVKDAAGNRSIYAGKSQSTSSDGVVPTAGTFTATSGITANGLQLNWSPGSDNITPINLLSYLVCKGATAVHVDSIVACKANVLQDFQTNIASMTVTNLQPNSTHYFNVIVKDEAGNESLFVMRPETTSALAAIASVHSSKPDGHYKAGAVIDIDVTFNRNVTVTSSPSITLAAGSTPRSANYYTGSGTAMLTFRYTVQNGDETADLDYSSTAALTGTISDSDNIAANLTLPAPGSAGSLGAVKEIKIDTTAPLAASSLSWNKTTPTKDTVFKAIWIKSTTSDVTRQEIQVFSAANCGSGQGGAAVDVGSSTAQEFSTNGTDGTTYSFKIISSDAAGNAVTSDCSSYVTVDTSPPGPPTNLAWAEKSSSDPESRVIATWNTSTSATSQKIQFYADTSCVNSTGGLLAVANVDANQVFNQDFGTAGSYTFRIFSYDDANNENQSACSPVKTHEILTCPTNYVKVGANSTVGVLKPFCVMKYEAKIVGNDYGGATYNSSSMTPESRATGTPWVNLGRDEAKAECESLGAGHKLISNEQWQAIAYEIELSSVGGTLRNWSGGQSNSSSINMGNVNSMNSLAASPNDLDGCSGIAGVAADCGGTWFSQKRNHMLADPSQVIWDFSGNVSEWVDTGAMLSGIPNFTEGYVSDWVSGIAADQKVRWLSSIHYTSVLGKGGLGGLDFSPLGTGVVRGGDYNDTNMAGVFAVDASVGLNAFSSTSGFRCVYTSQGDGT